MDTVLVIGAGRGQIPIMNLCHKYGFKVCAVSPKGNYPGINIADEVLFEDVKNKESILEYAKNNSIKAVLTDQLDEGVLTAAFVSENLGLKGISYSTALKFTNKFIMRKEAEKLGINVPKCISAQSLDEAKIKLKNFNFPVMMKPVDSAASRGVYRIDSLTDLENKFCDSVAFSKSKTVIIEEFIIGQEYVVEAYTSEYNVKNLVVGHRDYFDIKNVFIPNATVFSDSNSANSIIENRLKKINEKIVKGFSLRFGITHGEYLYNKEQDKIYLVEIAARGGGVFISSDLIPAACGVNANDLLVREVLGFDNEAIDLKNGSSAYFCYMLPKGKVLSISGKEDVKKLKEVNKAFFDNVGIGMEIGDITDKSSRKGPILVQGYNKESCYEVIEKVKQLLDIKVDTIDGVRGIIWN